jgi:hypothetical protein
MRERLRVRNIIDGDEINFRIAEACAKDITSDASETIDANLHSHSLSNLLLMYRFHTNIRASPGSISAIEKDEPMRFGLEKRKIMRGVLECQANGLRSSWERVQLKVWRESDSYAALSRVMSDAHNDCI